MPPLGLASWPQLPVLRRPLSSCSIAFGSAPAKLAERTTQLLALATVGHV